MRTRTIGAGLSLDDRDDTFCIFREHHSGLWFIRSCAEIHTRGLFVSLNGFESQVLVDIHQVSDTSDGKYRILCKTLAGKGSDNLENEWAEICYHNLYKALEQFLSVSFIGQVQKLTGQKQFAGHPVKAARAAAVLMEKYRTEALEFYRTAAVYAEMKTEHAEKDFTKLKKLVKELVILQNTTQKDKTRTETARKAIRSCTVNEFLRSILDTEPAAQDLFFCYAVAGRFADLGYAEKWFLSRKFDGCLQKAGIAEKSRQQQLSRLFMLASAPKVQVSDDRLTGSAYEIVLFLMRSSKAQQLCGVNTFADVHWFNSELTDNSIKWLSAIRLLSATLRRSDNILKLYRMLATAKEKSEYKCDLFIQQLGNAGIQRNVSSLSRKKVLKKEQDKKKSEETSKRSDRTM